MGIDYSCSIFYGVIFEYEEETVEETITRYDELTGKPYIKKMLSKIHSYQGRDWDEFCEELDELEYDNYEYIEQIHGDDIRGIGAVLANLDTNEYIEIPTVLPEMEKEVTEVLKKLNVIERPTIQVLFSAY